MDKTEQLVIEWSKARGIYEHSTVQAQTLKAIAEIGELADAVIKGDLNGIRDGIGDVMVCLTNVAFMKGFALSECYSAAYDEIKDRKGRMASGGAWVKEPVQLELDFTATIEKTERKVDTDAVDKLVQNLRKSGENGSKYADILDVMKTLVGAATPARVAAALTKEGTVSGTEYAKIWGRMQRMEVLGYLRKHPTVRGAYIFVEELMEG